MIQDPYSVLGVSPSATDDEIKAAYRKLAKKYHPDVNQGSPEAEQKMKEINEAYDMVINHKYTPGQNSYGSYGQNRSGGTYQGAGGFDPFEWFTGARYSQYGPEGDRSLLRPVGETGRRSVGNRKERFRD